MILDYAEYSNQLESDIIYLIDCDVRVALDVEGTTGEFACNITVLRQFYNEFWEKYWARKQTVAERYEHVAKFSENCEQHFIEKRRKSNQLNVTLNIEAEERYKLSKIRLGTYFTSKIFNNIVEIFQPNRSMGF